MTCKLYYKLLGALEICNKEDCYFLSCDRTNHIRKALCVSVCLCVCVCVCLLVLEFFEADSIALIITVSLIFKNIIIASVIRVPCKSLQRDKIKPT